MSLGPLMVGIEGTALTGAERRRLAAAGIGGVILFTRNFQYTSQLVELTADIHAIRTPPLLVATDHEGGRVQRFREGFTGLPAPALLGECYDRDARTALAATERVGWLMAAELRACGVDLSFAPVLDVERGVSRVIGDRAFHRRPEIVGRLAQAFARGMRRAGMVAVGKHFPGHGAVVPDSHLELPVDQRSFEAIEAEDLVPFRHLIRNDLEALLAGHVVYDQVDDRPAGFSRRWLQGVLRDRLGFEGAVFSDDLGMAAAGVAGDHAERAWAAVAAGCDMVILGNDPDAAEAALAGLPAAAPASGMRLARLHGRGHAAPDALRRNPEWRAAVETAEWLERGRSGELKL